MMVKGWFKTNITLLLLPIILSSCASLPPLPSDGMTNTPAKGPSQISWKDRESALSAIHNWQVNGKIAVQTRQDSGSAEVTWKQSNAHYSIALLGPLGGNALKLNGSSNHVRLQTSDGKSYEANSAEQLLAKQWGFNLPVSHLNYWVRGIPAPGTAQTQMDANGRLSAINQDGWHIKYLSYAHHGPYDLPERINIDSSTLRAKLIIYQWSIG